MEAFLFAYERHGLSSAARDVALLCCLSSPFRSLCSVQEERRVFQAVARIVPHVHMTEAGANALVNPLLQRLAEEIQA